LDLNIGIKNPKNLFSFGRLHTKERQYLLKKEEIDNIIKEAENFYGFFKKSFFGKFRKNKD
jgi:hypothetical protein